MMLIWKRLFQICITNALLLICVYAQGNVFNKYTLDLARKLTADYTPNISNAPYVIVAEQRSNNIIMLDVNKDWADKSAEVWRWEPKKANGMPNQYAKWFTAIDECKPALKASHIIATASAGGVAIVRVSDKKVVFFAHAGNNPHSACLLPDGNVVVASSTDKKLTLYSTSNYKQGQPCPVSAEYTLPSAHGVVWDKSQQILWALGFKTLIGYKYNFNRQEPKLTVAYSHNLPELAVNGHDLYPAPNTKYLFITGRKGIVLFDTQTQKFCDLASVRHIKSVSMSAPNGQVIFIKPTEKWWSPSVVAGNKQLSKIATYPNGRIYKARWFIPNEFSESN